MMIRIKITDWWGNPERGFTLLEVLTVAVIIVILTGAASVSYVEVGRRAKEHLCAERLTQIGTYEKFYIREFGEYGLFQDLQTQGYIDPNYVEADDKTHSSGIPFAPDYVLTFDLSGADTFRVDAVSALDDPNSFTPRWRLIGGIWDVRALYIDDRGQVRLAEDDRPLYR